MTRSNHHLVYSYHPIPPVIPPSKHSVGIIDALDVAVENEYETVRDFLIPIGHPNSKRYFLQLYKASQVLKAKAKDTGVSVIADADDFTIIRALKRVTTRRGISPRQLLIGARDTRTATAAE